MLVVMERLNAMHILMSQLVGCLKILLSATVSIGPLGCSISFALGPLGLYILGLGTYIGENYFLVQSRPSCHHLIFTL